MTKADPPPNGSLIDEGFEPPISEDQRAELERRLTEHQADPDAVVHWKDAKQRFRRK